jgi:polysaccharide biosynthesis transport protein
MRNQNNGNPMSNTATMNNSAPMTNFQAPNQQIPVGAYGYSAPPTIPTEPNRNIPTFIGLLNALKRRWALASFIGMIVGCGVGLGVWLATPKGKHAAVSKMHIAQRSGQGEDAFRRYKNYAYSLIYNSRLLSKVCNDPEVRQLQIMETEKPIGRLEGMIQRKWGDSEDIINVYINGDDKDQIQTLLTKYTFYLEQDAKDFEQKDLDDKKKILQQNLEIIDNTLREIKEKGDALALANGTGETLKVLEESLQKNKDALRTLRTEQSKLKNQAETIKKRQAVKGSIKLDPTAVDKELSKNPLVIEKAQILSLARENFETIKKTSNPGGLLYEKAEKEVNERQADLNSVKESQKPDAERIVAETQSFKDLSKLEEIDTKLEDIESSIKTHESNEQKDTNNISKARSGKFNSDFDKDEVKPLQERREYYLKKIGDLNLQEPNWMPMRAMDDVTVHTNENQKQRIVASLMGAVVGFALVLCLVSYLEWRSRKVDSVDQVMTELGMRVIGTIPCFPSRANLKAGGAEQNQNWRFILNESVNSTRTMLLHTAKTQSMQVIMVTSAMQGEGKTSLSSQLATSMATAGLRTLILDCDLRNPSIHRLFDVALTPGCSEILCQEVDVSDAVQPTSVPNLWMIPAGQCSNRVISALAQGHPLETLFNRLRGQFDFIVVDTCPVLPVADALLIGQHVDGVVFSILQDISQMPKVIDASERMNQLNIPLLGAVVNGIRVDTHAYGYNYVKQLPA